MKRLLLPIILLSSFLVFFAANCEGGIYLIIDEYDSPSAIHITPSDNSLTVNFNSYISAKGADFAGFVIYLSTSSNFDTATALTNTNGYLPTYPYITHDYSSFSYTVSSPLVTNLSSYYLTVCAYGTNEFAPEGIIVSDNTEMYFGCPRSEGTILLYNNTLYSSTADALFVSSDLVIVSDMPNNENTSAVFYCVLSTYAGSLTPVVSSGSISGYSIQDLGYVSSFNEITSLPSDGYADSSVYLPLADKHLYALTDGTYYIKIWIENFSVASAYNVGDSFSFTVKWAKSAASVRDL